MSKRRKKELLKCSNGELKVAAANRAKTSQRGLFFFGGKDLQNLVYKVIKIALTCPNHWIKRRRETRVEIASKLSQQLAAKWTNRWTLPAAKGHHTSA